MKVLKRNGQVQEFSMNKVKTSIRNASEDTHKPITDGDVEILSRAIERRLDALMREEITSNDIFEQTLLVLMKYRFYNLAKQYREGATGR
ncbi:ATP cone domain-containing protein [Oceanirhabdus sp. W0125-5]|uniref:ATP cone domain-containing protein n=1 Tax=Oceanirhabdus sp. W0125-5 TaxID=2999116 RepID=UPI0022F2CBC2|nr:ATP cone domain-containing protein [Oceanirhabdus sp. W0125-5]WBW95711.1 ATP cone domain-containing protein [Oceanirhabdus sp. W0125-5]